MSLPLLTGWDWFVLITLGLSSVLGLVRGLVRTLFGLASWLVALLLTPVLAPLLIDRIELAQFAIGIWVLLFIGLFALVRVSGHALAGGLRATGLGGVDRLGGALFGVIRALALIVLVVAGATLMVFDREPMWRDAASRPLLDAIADWIEPHLPRRESGIRTT
ncbi:MAG: CvpA family protein [Burkholderiales bacterium]|nr:CvpA family protein [Burkholderiales bacterium]